MVLFKKKCQPNAPEREIAMFMAWVLFYDLHFSGKFFICIFGL